MQINKIYFSYLQPDSSDNNSNKEELKEEQERVRESQIPASEVIFLGRQRCI